MNKSIYIFLNLLFMATLSGCASIMSSVSFEVLQPSPVTYPAYVRNIAFLNRAPFSLDSFDPVNQSGLDYGNLLILDSLICDNLHSGFIEGNKINEQSYQKQFQYFDYRRRDTIGKANLLTRTAMKGFFDSYPIDAIISLEYYSIRLDKSIQKYDFSTGLYKEEFRLVYELYWRIYAKEESKPVDQYTQRDTLYYMNDSGMSADEMINSTDILRDGMTEAGYRYGIRQVPLWNEISRGVFIGRDEALTVAGKGTDIGDWEMAKEIWMENSSSEDVKLAGKSLYNMAVYYELEDQLDSAKLYSSKALYKWNNPYLEAYDKDLEVRILNKEDLQKQVR